MEKSFGSRLKHAWNVFLNGDRTDPLYETGQWYNYRPDRPRFSKGNEKSIVTSVYNRIAMDAASIDIQHVQLDDNNRFLKTIDSGLNTCLTLEANLDQTGRAFIHDAVMSMLDEGELAIVPVETTLNPDVTNSYDILKMRTGKILEWYPSSIKVRVYNERTGMKEEKVVPKNSSHC